MTEVKIHTGKDDREWRHIPSIGVKQGRDGVLKYMTSTYCHPNVEDYFKSVKPHLNDLVDELKSMDEIRSDLVKAENDIFDYDLLCSKLRTSDDLLNEDVTRAVGDMLSVLARVPKNRDMSAGSLRDFIANDVTKAAPSLQKSDFEVAMVKLASVSVDKDDTADKRGKHDKPGAKNSLIDFAQKLDRRNKKLSVETAATMSILQIGAETD